MQSILLDLEQGSPEWLAWRRDGVGSSDIAAIMGISPFPGQNMEELYFRKTIPADMLPMVPETPAMQRGKLLEPVARTRYRNGLKGTVIRVCCAVHPEYPWARASLDGLCHYAERPGDHWLLEIKAPRDEVHKETIAGQVPDHYMVQVQWQLFVTGLFWCDYASYSDSPAIDEGNRLVVVRFRRDDALIARLWAAAAAFWRAVQGERRACRGERD